VLRLLRGEPLEVLSRELGVEAHRLAAWRPGAMSSWRPASRASRVSEPIGPRRIGSSRRPSARSAS
jgi:hypothetical protein